MKWTFMMLILLSSSITSQAQKIKGYSYFWASIHLQSTDIYAFTSPKAFKYRRESPYVFPPAEHQQQAIQTIESQVRYVDPQWAGLLTNQLVSSVSTADFEETMQIIKEKMKTFYNAQRHQSYRKNPVAVVLFDIDTGQILFSYTLQSTSQVADNQSVANVY